MKKNLFILIVLMCTSFVYNTAFSQGNTTPDFTNLNDPAVTCYYGSFSDPFQSEGIVNGRHTLITSQGYDIETGSQLPYLPPGENKIIRLGNSNTGSQAEAIRYRFKVDYFKSVLLLKFAVVFEDPGHPSYQQPRFTVRVTDLNGQLVESCAEYDVTAAGNIPGFNSYGSTRWRPWTNVGIDLSPYIGSEIIVEFITKDCDQSGHFGYAYFTASCIQNNLDVTSCNGNDITLNAPNDFQSYYWSNGSSSQQAQFTLTDTSLDAWCDITSVTGCVFRLNAHISKEDGLPAQDTVIYDTICYGSSYEKNFFNLPVQGIEGDYVFLNTICNLNECDYATITLLLNVSNKVPDTHIYEDICTDTIINYNNYGFILNDLTFGDSIYQQYNTTIDGCDSIVYLHLSINPVWDTLIFDTICQWDSYMQYGFVLDSMHAGLYQDTLYLNTINGCDSIVKLNLTVNPTYDTIISAAICEGESYTENGFSFINKPAGSYNDILSLNTIHGCDSIVRLNLTINPTYDITISESICEGESYKDNGFVFENMTVGSYNDVQLLSSVNGCDSIVRLELTVNPNYEITISESICEGEDYTENGFSFIDKPAGSYQDYLMLNSSNGCDSIVKLQLTINKTYRYDIYDSICEGEDYNLYGLNLISPSAGLFEHICNLHTVNGCDSVYNINLKVITKYDEIVIEGLENISVATNLATGCYRYTVGNVGRHEHYTWEIDNHDWKIIPNNNECVVCATTPGNGTLYVRAENSCGSVSDYIVLNAEFIEDQDNANVRIYPNPITDIVNIQQSDISRINVYDSYGQLVLRNDYNFDSHVTLDLSSLKNSVYIIEIITLEKTFVERINIIK